MALEFLMFIVILSMSACGPLPRPGVLRADLGILPVSDDLTGIVLASTDSSYTATDLYFYNLANGHLELLVGGESGDVLLKWVDGKLWIFNRAAGRVSYSALSPKVGVASRNIEHRTPDAVANDPTDVIWSGGDQVLFAMGGAHKVTVANLKSGIAISDKLESVDTNDRSVPFRPGVLVPTGEDIAVFHQSLDANWQAVGGGAVYLARPDESGIYAWVDQDVAVAAIQGLRLNVSNPVQSMECEKTSDRCFVAGSCFESMGTGCVGGVDIIEWGKRSVTNQMTWPSGSYSAGSVSRGVKAGQVTSCLKLSGEVNARLVLYNLSSQSQVAQWDTGTPWCGPFVVDRAGGRVLIAQKIGVDSFLI